MKIPSTPEELVEALTLVSETSKDVAPEDFRYVLYVRKSTDDKDKQVRSLKDQIAECREFAEDQNIRVVKIIQESESAKQPDIRPGFRKMLEDIKAGVYDGILAWHPDRLARNFIDGGLIIDLLQRGVLKSIQTYEKEYLPTDNVLMMAVELGMANQYSRDLSESVKRGNRQKLMQGGWPCHVPFGYRNNKADKTLFVDPVHGKHVQMIFEYYSTGLYSFGELIIYI